MKMIAQNPYFVRVSRFGNLSSPPSRFISWRTTNLGGDEFGGFPTYGSGRRPLVIYSGLEQQMGCRKMILLF